MPHKMNLTNTYRLLHPTKAAECTDFSGRIVYSHGKFSRLDHVKP
jgi:hypothetical protein